MGCTGAYPTRKRAGSVDRPTSNIVVRTATTATGSTMYRNRSRGCTPDLSNGQLSGQARGLVGECTKQWPYQIRRYRRNSLSLERSLRGVAENPESDRLGICPTLAPLRIVGWGFSPGGVPAHEGSFTRGSPALHGRRPILEERVRRPVGSLAAPGSNAHEGVPCITPKKGPDGPRYRRDE